MHSEHGNCRSGGHVRYVRNQHGFRLRAFFYKNLENKEKGINQFAGCAKTIPHQPTQDTPPQKKKTTHTHEDQEKVLRRNLRPWNKGAFSHSSP